MMNDEPPAKKPATKRKTKATKFKKAPQAPKRFKSAFMFFSTKKHPEIRLSLKDDENANANVPHVAKLVAAAWRELSQEDRAIWDKRSSDDKKRYEVEKAMYTGPWKIPASKRARKDPNAPKRPMSAFLAYSQRMRSVAKQDNQHLSNTEISKLLAEMWREAPDDIRREHIEQESEQRARYKLLMGDWRSKQEEALLSQRKQREQIALDVIANGGGDEEIRKHRQQMAAQSVAQTQHHAAAMYPQQSRHNSGPPPQYSQMEPPREDPSRFYSQTPYYNSNPPPPQGGYSYYPPYQEMPPGGRGPYMSAPTSWGPEAPTSSSQQQMYPERRSSEEHSMAPPPQSHYSQNYDPSHYNGSESSPGNVPGHPASSSSSSTYERSDPVYSYGNSHSGYNQGGYQQPHSYYG